MRFVMASKVKNIYYGFLIGIFLLSIFTVFILKQNKLLVNIEFVQNYNSVKTNRFRDNEKLKLIVPKVILTNDISFEKDIKKALNYVATVIDGRYISNPNLTAYQKLNSILTQKRGGLCGDLAIILKGILIAKGYKARTIQLLRQIASYSYTHVVTEVWSESLHKFILLDPTFNLMIKSNNKYINANELINIVLYKKSQLDILENPRKNVAKYKEYYADYFAFYNNVLIVTANKFSGYKRIFSKLPILNSYLGGKYYVQDNDGVKGVARLYKIFYLYIPTFLLINILLLIFLKIKNTLNLNNSQKSENSAKIRVLKEFGKNLIF